MISEYYVGLNSWFGFVYTSTVYAQHRLWLKVESIYQVHKLHICLLKSRLKFEINCNIMIKRAIITRACTAKSIIYLPTEDHVEFCYDLSSVTAILLLLLLWWCTSKK